MVQRMETLIEAEQLAVENMTATADTQMQRNSSDGRARRLANLRPFPKGVSGNPGGRPKGQSLTAELRRLAMEGDTPRQIAQQIIEKARTGSIDHLRLLFDRCEGLLTKPISVEAKDKPLESLTEEQLHAIIWDGMSRKKLDEKVRAYRIANQSPPAALNLRDAAPAT